MGLFRGVPRWLRYALFLGLLFPLVLTLILVATMSDGEGEGGRLGRKGSPSGNARKPLVVGKRDIEDLRFQVTQIHVQTSSI